LSPSGWPTARVVLGRDRPSARPVHGSPKALNFRPRRFHCRHPRHALDETDKRQRETPMETLQDRVITTIARAVPLERDTIRLDSTFDDLGIESLDVVNIVFELEDEFDLEIPDDFNLSQLGNVGEVKTAIETFLAGGADNVGR
jgi:acyl carrier protein